MNPLEKFLLEKQAAKVPGFGEALSTGLRRAPGAMGGALAQGAATAVAGAGVAGLGVAAGKIYHALTKRRDFNQMLDANPDLLEQHASDPKRFNLLFTTLRTMNPAFAADPVVAGTYMRRMSENPLTAGGIAVEALGHRETTKSPALESFMKGGLEGTKSGLKAGFGQKGDD